MNTNVYISISISSLMVLAPFFLGPLLIRLFLTELRILLMILVSLKSSVTDGLDDIPLERLVLLSNNDDELLLPPPSLLSKLSIIFQIRLLYMLVLGYRYCLVYCLGY